MKEEIHRVIARVREIQCSTVCCMRFLLLDVLRASRDWYEDERFRSLCCLEKVSLTQTCEPGREFAWATGSRVQADATDGG